MAIVAALPTLTSVEDAVNEIYRLARDSGINIHDATCEIFPLLRLSPEQRDMLALEGLYQRAMHEKKGASTARRQPVGWGAPHGHKWERYMKSLGHPYKAADGTAKPLIEFTLTDLAAYATLTRAMADGYMRRADWASEAQETLERCGKSRIRDLPDAEIVALAKAADEAFGRQE